MTTVPPGFDLRGAVHLIRPWDRTAANLGQLREGIAEAPPEVIFNHAVQYPLRSAGAEELPVDDFSGWVGGVLSDGEAAERLSFVVQVQGGAPEPLRAGLTGVLDELGAKRTAARVAPEGSEFHFLSAQTLTYPCGIEVHDGQALVEALVTLDPSTWFFHLVEDPWYGGGRVPLLEWLRGSGESRLAGWLDASSRSGQPIDAARRRLLRRWRRSRIGSRVAAATRLPDDVRRTAGREVLARLVRRRSDPGESP